MSRSSLLSWAAILCLGGSSYGADLRSPYNWETTTVLPAKVIQTRYIQFHLDHNSQYSNGGVSESLGNRISRVVPWKLFLGMQKDVAARTQMGGLLQRLGVSAAGDLGQATGTISASATARVPGVSYGITDNWSVGLVVPIVDINLGVTTGFNFTPEGQRFMGALCTTSREKCVALEQTLAGVSNAKLTSLNYKPLQSERISGLGDIQLATKYRWYHDETQNLSTRLGVFLPTGTASDADRVLDITTGENRYRAALIATYDRMIIGPLRGNVHAGYSSLFANGMTKRLPASAEEPLSADKAEVTREYAHRAFFGTGLDHGIDAIGVTLSAAYHYQHQSKGTYRANGAAATRAALLERFEPSQDLHSFVAGLGFSTVKWYRQKSFFLPFELTLLYSQPVAGRNVPNGTTLSGELVAYF